MTMEKGALLTKAASQETGSSSPAQRAALRRIESK